MQTAIQPVNSLSLLPRPTRIRFRSIFPSTIGGPFEKIIRRNNEDKFHAKTVFALLRDSTAIEIDKRTGDGMAYSNDTGILDGAIFPKKTKWTLEKCEFFGLPKELD